MTNGRKRALRAWGLFAAGKTLREVADIMGGVNGSYIGVERARQLVRQGARQVMFQLRSDALVKRALERRVRDGGKRATLGLTL